MQSLLNTAGRSAPVTEGLLVGIPFVVSRARTAKQSVSLLSTPIPTKLCSWKYICASIRYRLLGLIAAYKFLNEIAGANRYFWNAALANVKHDYEKTS